MKPGARAEIVAFALVVSAIILAADALVLGKMVPQLRTSRYRATEGVMQASRTVGHPTSTSKGRLLAHNVFVQYTYSVGGKDYAGTELRHNFIYSGDRGDDDQMLMRYPEGSRVQVFYDPRDPANAVLEVGLIGKDILLMAFMTPLQRPDARALVRCPEQNPRRRRSSPAPMTVSPRGCSPSVPRCASRARRISA